MTDDLETKKTSDLPSALRLDNATLSIIEASKVKKFIGPLIFNAHERKVKRIVLLSWDNEEATRVAGQLLAVAFSQQLEQKCALIISEGIRYTCDNYDSFNLIRLPEMGAATAEENQKILNEMDETYPFQIIAGPTLNSWSKYSIHSTSLAREADAHILLLPEGGLSRSVMRKIEKFSKTKKIKWLGIINIARGNG